MKIFIIFLTLVFQVIASNYCHRFRTKTDSNRQERAVVRLIERLIPARVAEFEVQVNNDLYENDCKDKFITSYNALFVQIKIQPLVHSKIRIKATTGVAAANGLRYYLKEYCNCHVSWSGNQLSVPDPLPQPSKNVTVVIHDKIRYYQNVCTQSYSFVWWDWNRWEQEIDYMALLGLNTALMFTGQEYIWKKIFIDFGLTEDEVNDFFSGPAFLAWNRMGNIQKWGGPLSDNWHKNQFILAKRTVERMRDFGMLTVFPAFAGHVPRNITRVYPNATVTKLSSWVGFNCTYSCTSFLEPEDPLFVKIGSAFVNEYINIFGTDHIYNSDLFNEMTPRTRDPSYLSACGKAVYKSIVTADPNGVWMMQAWIFVNNPAFWGRDQSKALLTSVPQGKMLLLDLYSEIMPTYNRFDGFFGQPWIWNMLHNFGGVMGIYGAMDLINDNVYEARKKYNSSMIGVGLTPEGIKQNDIMYHFMMDTIWNDDSISVDKWVAKYAEQRFGVGDFRLRKALLLLRRNVYSALPPINNHESYVVTKRPSFRLQETIWYIPNDLFTAWYLFVNATDNPLLKNSKTFKYDLVDIGRDSLALLLSFVHKDIVAAFRKKNTVKLIEKSYFLLEILQDINLLLSTEEEFLLGRWLNASKSLATNEEEKILYEFNARNQITLWGPDGQIVDYATKQWAGIYSDYYYPRWKLFVETLIESLERGIRFKQSVFNKKVFRQVESPFCESTKEFPTKATDDAFTVSISLYQKYKQYLSKIGIN